MLESIEAAASRRAWGHQEELLAMLLEVNHALLVSFMQVHVRAQDKHLVPKALHVPRPGEPIRSKAISPASLARAVAGGD